jgi:DNA replication initiation complex subunit (GINS family)
MNGDKIGFSEISDVHRNERRSKVLTKLPPHFHERAEEHLQGLKDEHCTAVQSPNNPNSMMLWDQISKVDKRLKLIYEIRERKITLAALDRMVGAAPPDNMTKRERMLYEKLVEILGYFRDNTMDEPNKECPAPVKAAEPTPEPEAFVKTQSVLVEPSPAEATAEAQETTIVHVLEDIPEFAGMNTDYELKKDDMVTLPAQFAALLSSRGKVRIVSG